MPRLLIRLVVRRVLVSCTAGGAVLLGASVLGTPALVQSPMPGDPVPAAPGAAVEAPGAARVEALLRRHGCWSGTAPAGAPDPRHAVVTGADGRSRLVDAEVGYGIWLGGEKGVLHGFCP